MCISSPILSFSFLSLFTFAPTSFPIFFLRRLKQARKCTLRKGRRGFGFVLRGAKAASPLMEMVPSEKCPGLQYMDDVDPGGVADQAGVRKGDFLLEVSGGQQIPISAFSRAFLGRSISPILRADGRKNALSLDSDGTAKCSMKNASAYLNGFFPSRDKSPPPRRDRMKGLRGWLDCYVR